MTAAPQPDVIDCDVLIVGSGAAGLSAAVTAAWHGQKVIVVEKDAVFGGATAWSGGWAWVPCNPLAKRAGIIEDVELPRTYLKHELGERYDPAMIDAFLEAGPRMVAFFERHTRLQFADGNAIADIHGDTPGAGTGGRSVIAAPYNGREVGKLLKRLRKTMRETSFMGMPIMAGPDLAAFLNLTRSLPAAWHVTKRFGRHLIDLALHGRALQLVNGVALVARLAKSAEDLGVLLWESAPVTSLTQDEAGVTGAVVKTARGDIRIRARKAVVLAAGGFANDIERRKALFPRTPTGHEHLALPPLGVNGDGLTLGESAGGQINSDLHSTVAWAPVSRVTHSEGSIGHFPHIIERAKPGIIGVLSNGQRFVNEANGYYDYVTAMVEQAPAGEPVASWLICTHDFQRRYGLGISRPFPIPVGPFIQSGYLKSAYTLEGMARVCGIDAKGLQTTVDDYNRHAQTGQDPQFGRGSTPYNRKQGDPLHKPNPCVAPISKGPFYAVKVEPGCFGTFAGLKTNEHAQVLNADGQAIKGLYAAGTDMASIMGGYYPAGGINLGPALTFGYIAGRHMAGVTQYE
ncbi:MAG: FAD-dependent oxidoreductase [Pseudomonas helleri]|jgi:succinate dehydrogenase/fumarate reductase flavoprotein subunit|uniref:FAD-dependent oxidoreductase n=1 Tax=Pseudomonas helleri TaxID=1608996 RepID=A0A6A7ZG98_9PSED|nr:FAD-dependent oxidoreductase [Pseudomonas helleri]MQT37740.1 FAD-dependent oxidoreductase [Pseudomonas helleri]MQU22830.1 FAD-dependent oxidoreductase [Pseudomonas helleri]MQU44083.1 FAD-dependent oxidoreductase [Pseudomonas helleri]MQU59439.1 FAD-dependent oxidoreductase [Pseudomonas helleri]